jgi:repressor of nif and glnA expression
MKRDMDLARKILKLIEDDADPNNFTDLDLEPLEGQGYNHEQIAYHVRLLHEAELVDAKSTNQGVSYKVRSLTWEGHDFLEASRDDTIWEKAKNIVLKKTGGIAFETLKATLIDLGKNAVKEITQTYFQ